MTIQTNLETLYRRFKNTVRVPRDLARHLSPPLLLYVTNTWQNHRPRILVIGKETHTWSIEPSEEFPQGLKSFDDFLRNGWSIAALIKAYEDFQMGFKYRGRHFWRAYREVRREFGTTEEGIETNILWTNLNRVDLDGKSIHSHPADRTGPITVGTGILSREIAILKPDIAIFFTGPSLDQVLESEFHGVRFASLKSHEKRQLALLSHPKLPRLSIRTYHPRYLYLRQPLLLGEVIGEIRRQTRSI